MSCKNFLKVCALLVVTIIILHACTAEKGEDILITEELNFQIDIRWFTGSFMQTEDEMKIGLSWALSYLGAFLPTGSLENALTVKDKRSFSLDLDKVGFSPEAEKALVVILEVIKSSDEYKQKGYVDLGRFLMLTLNSSNHYYQITQAPPIYDDFLANYEFTGKTAKVINSSITNLQRLIQISDAEDFDEVAYASTEGSGTFQMGTFTAKEFEVLDIMPNGQLRFAVYNLDGRLISSADPQFTSAGKPSKCLWCHESKIQPFFVENPVLSQNGSLTEEEFLVIREEYSIMVDLRRDSLNGVIDYKKLLSSD